MKQKDKPTEETLNKWHKDPTHWKLGFLYFNKEDKRIFPPKRIKYLGWTINFANPLSIIGFIVLLAAVLVLLKIFK